jgi:hypothetical protein
VAVDPLLRLLPAEVVAVVAVAELFMVPLVQKIHEIKKAVRICLHADQQPHN